MWPQRTFTLSEQSCKNSVNPLTQRSASMSSSNENRSIPYCHPCLTLIRKSLTQASGWALMILVLALEVHPAAAETSGSPSGAAHQPSPHQTDTSTISPVQALPLTPVQSMPAVPLRSEAYILGAGDAIRVDIFDVPEFSGQNGQYTLSTDGSINLPWVGRVVLQGMNAEAAARYLSDRYARYVKKPLITVTLLTARPLRVGVIGQVNRPGVYQVPQGAAAQRLTVTQAIQAAGGIAQMANIREIQVRRPNYDGTEDILNVNLWDFLQGGQIGQDLALRDGDTLIIPQATALNPEEVTQLSAANFAPATMTVNIVGEVTRPGGVAVPPNTTLNQAILAAGGFNNSRARRNRVELIRLNPNGTVTKRTVAVDLAAGINETTNPLLRPNDVVVVGRSTLAETSDFLGSLLSPLNGIFSVFRLFGF